MPILSRNPRRDWRRTTLLVLAILSAGTLLTGAAYGLLRTRLEATAQAAFAREVDAMAEGLTLRFGSYARLLQAAAELLHGNDQRVRETLRSFVAGSDIQARLPGIQGVGYAPRVLPHDALAHVERMRREGMTGYAIWPVGARDMYFPIAVLEPLTARNQRALGFDMYADPSRREAMDRAAATGQPALTGRVRLVQDADDLRQHGFLLYVPVFASAPGEAIVPPVRELLGYVYAPFRAEDQFRGALADRDAQVDVAIYDGSEALAESLMFRTTAAAIDGVPAWTATRHLKIHGRQWLLRAESPPFAQASPRAAWLRHAVAIGAVATVLAALLAVLVEHRHARVQSARAR